MMSKYFPLLKDEYIIIMPQEPMPLNGAETITDSKEGIEKSKLLRKLISIELKYNIKKREAIHECESSNIWGGEEEVYFTRKDNLIVNDILDIFNNYNESDDYLLDMFEKTKNYKFGVNYFMIINILNERQKKLLRANQRLALATSSLGEGLGYINKLPGDLLEEIIF